MASNSLKNPGILWLRKSGNPACYQVRYDLQVNNKVKAFIFQPCHVVYTDYRPTPLQHYIFPAGGDGIHMVVDEQVSLRK